MTPENIDRVFGRGRLKMVTGEHVEVYREEALPGERRRYTKRFLSSMGGDFRQWTEREWRILARLVGHGIGPVPDVVQFDRGAGGRPALVQTYDAGVTVDHWATLLPVERDGEALRHVFEDCAHWWALARHGLIALDAIHALQLVHLDLKADNVCIPHGPADFDPRRPGQALHPVFEQIALIDFAFSLVSGEPLQTALPIGHQADYEYQSPRLLDALEAGRRGNLLPTRQLDWRCDVFSLAAMLRRYLPSPEGGRRGGWSDQRLAAALSLIRRLVDAHDRGTPAQRPHKELIELTSRVLREKEHAASLVRGWRLARHETAPADAMRTPITRIAPPVLAAAGRDGAHALDAAAAPEPPRVRRGAARAVLWASGAVAMVALAAPWIGEAWWRLHDQRSAKAAAEALPPMVAAAPVPVPAPAPAPAVAPAAASAPGVVAAPASASASNPANDAAGPVSPAASAPAEPVVATAAPAPPVPSATPVRPAAPARRAVAKPPLPRHVAAPARSVPYLLPRPSVTALAPPFALAAGTVHSRSATHANTPAPATVAAPPPAWPAASPPVAIAAAPPPVATADSAPAPAAIPSTPPRTAEPERVAPALPEDFALRAAVLMNEHLPRLAQRAEPRVLRALHVAAQADNPWQQSEVAEIARSVRLPSGEALPAVPSAAMDAKLLNDAAEAAFWNGRNVQQAVSLQTRAFGAQPQDEVVAGNLAFYYLKQRPVRAEAARQLALYALTMPDPRFPQGRIEDWTNFAIASALVGRERDARNALFVTLALSPAIDRQCRSALAAVAWHGERMRAPTEAMLARIRSWGRSQESSFCRWPPSWSASNQAP